MGAIAVVVILVAMLSGWLAAPVAAEGGGVYVSEVFFNAPGQDEGHEFIELRNHSGDAVDVSGWSFTQGVTFTFPDGSIIGPGAETVVAADADDFEAVWGLPTALDFAGKLSNSGETITLVDLVGDVVESFTYDDVLPWPVSPDGAGDSLVRLDPDAPADSSTAWLGGTPTPAAANAPHAEVVFSAPRGWYGADQSVTLSSSVPGATIRYNTDGSANLSKVYSGPITVRADGDIDVIQAAVEIGGGRSRIQTHTYVSGVDRGIPVVATWSNGFEVADGESEATRSFEFIPPPSTGLEAVGANAGIRASAGGGGGLGQSDKVFFRGEYGAGTLDADLFRDRYYGLAPRPKIDQLFLRAEHQDRTHLKQIVAHDALLALGQLSPHGRFVNYHSNGTNRGVRHLQERPEGGFMEAYTGIDKQAWFGANRNGELEVDRPFASWAELERQIDVEQVIDFLLVEWQANQLDGFGIKNFRAVGPADSALANGGDFRWNFFNWDLDLSYFIKTGWPSSVPAFYSPGGIATELSSFAKFRLLMSDRVACAHFGDGALTKTKMLARADQRVAELAAAGKDDSGLRDSFEDFVPARNAWLLGQYRLPNATIGRVLGPLDPLNVSVTNGKASISGPGNHPIWYRLDGGDPRTPTGELDPAAIEYSGPIALAAGRHRIIARSLDNSQSDPVAQWSPACNKAAAFDVAVADNPNASPGEGLIINEIHYNPLANGLIDGDRFEFLELFNTTPDAINVSEFSFSAGINWTAPAGMTVAPGDYLVLASDAEAFESRYGFTSDGDYGGRLDDGGETVTLVDALGTLIDEVSYTDEFPWPTEPDTGGPSLTLIDTDIDNDLADSWRPSIALGGTPAALNDPLFLSPTGDVNCDGTLNPLDVLAVLEYAVGKRTKARCPLPDPATQLDVTVGDFNLDRNVDLADALIISQCAALINNGLCPD